MVRVSSRRLTASQFEAAHGLARITEERAKLARLAMVDGQSLQGVADLYGRTKSYVSDAVRVIWDAHERFLESQRVAAAPLLPPGWEIVTLAAPSSIVPELRARVAEAAAEEAGRAAQSRVKQGRKEKARSEIAPGRTST